MTGKEENCGRGMTWRVELAFNQEGGRNSAGCCCTKTQLGGGAYAKALRFAVSGTVDK